MAMLMLVCAGCLPASDSAAAPNGSSLTPQMRHELMGIITARPEGSPRPSRDKAVWELQLLVGETIALATAGLPYREVVSHLGPLSDRAQQALDNGDGAASINPASELFSEIVIHLGRSKPETVGKIVALEFITRKGSFDMDDMRTAFGQWHRSPKNGEKASFAVAWFPRYDAMSGARYFMYAEDGEYVDRIDPKRTPVRIFVQTSQFRWGS